MFNEFDTKSYALPRTGVEFSSSRPELKRVFDDCERLLKDNIKVYNGRRVLIEGSNYRNVWLETQPMGGEMYAKRDVEVGLNNLLIFMQYQRRDGRMPGMISDMSDRMLGVVAHYDWIQGFYFAHQALRMCDWIGPDERYLRLVAGAMEDFYGYIMKYRTGNPNGIPEEWCVWDSGEDNCARFLRLGARDGGFGSETPPQDSGRLPFQSMEYAGYCYDMAATLAEIHDLLGDDRSGHWRNEAAEHRRRVKAHLWNESRGACFDRDRDGVTIDSLNHINLRCMHLGLFDDGMARTFIQRHLLNPDEFWTKLPMPATAIHDLFFVNDPVNNWSGSCQGLIYQRAVDALMNYGRHDLVARLGEIWLSNLARNGRYVQQYDPFTGDYNDGIDGYGPTMLAALEYIAMMYGGVRRRDRLLFSAVGGADASDYTQHMGERTLRVMRRDGKMRALLNGREVYSGNCGQCVVTDLQGQILSVERI